jgi:hypothetical protein
MTRYRAELRYFPGDPLEDIKNSDLKTLEKEYGVNLSCAKTENREMKDGLLRLPSEKFSVWAATQGDLACSRKCRDRGNRYAPYRRGTDRSGVPGSTRRGIQNK